MEGAAFFYVCLQEKVPFIQIRGISNYVGEQNKSKWDIDLAISSLNAVILEFLSELK
jgi:futalosine hydrolase